MIGGSGTENIWKKNKISLRMLMEKSEGEQEIIDDYINKLEEIDTEYQVQLRLAYEYMPEIYDTVITDGDRKGLGSGGEYRDYVKMMEKELETIGEMKTVLSNPEEDWADKGNLSILGDKSRENLISKIDELNTQYLIHHGSSSSSSSSSGSTRAAMKKKKLTKEGKKWVKAAEKDMKRRTRKQKKKLTKKKKKKIKQTHKLSLKKEKNKMISEKEYKMLINKRQHNQKLSLSQRKKLDHALFVNYCSCIKHLKYDKKVKDYLEYPFCMSSIYTKRGFKSPKNIMNKCKKFE
jgi:hypothetical protein